MSKYSSKRKQADCHLGRTYFQNTVDEMQLVFKINSKLRTTTNHYGRDKHPVEKTGKNYEHLAEKVKTNGHC